MTLSSAQLDCLTTSTSTITLTSTGSNYYGSGGTITFTNSPSAWCISPSTSTICHTTIGGLSISNINIFSRQEFVDCFPEWSRIEKMCDEYPGLKIAFEKFKTTYNLIKDDYDIPKDQRPKP